MLHHVKLPEPRLIEWVTCCVYNMAQTILLRDHEHGIQDTLHGISRTNKCRPRMLHQLAPTSVVSKDKTYNLCASSMKNTGIFLAGRSVGLAASPLGFDSSMCTLRPSGRPFCSAGCLLFGRSHEKRIFDGRRCGIAGRVGCGGSSFFFLSFRTLSGSGVKFR